LLVDKATIAACIIVVLQQGSYAIRRIELILIR
jgi:hypothetical protein